MVESSHVISKVTITTDSGKEIRGIIGSKPPHVLTPEERKKPMEIKNMFIDIGVSSKEEAEEAGVEVGNMVTRHIVNLKCLQMINI